MKRGISSLLAGILLVSVVVVLGTTIFVFVSETGTGEAGKSGDKSFAQDICRENVKIRITNVELGNEIKIHMENLRSQDISDFVVRLESGGEASVRKVKRLLGGYEIGIVSVSSEGFNPDKIKVIPQIVLSSPDIGTVNEGWWLCSDQLVIYEI